MNNVVYGDMLCSGVAIIPFEVDKTVACGPCGSVGCPKGCDEIGLSLCGCSRCVDGGVVVFLYVGPFCAEDAWFCVMPDNVGLLG